MHDDANGPGDEIETVVQVPIGDTIDLHPFAPRDIPSVVEAYLEAAHEAGLREVRLVHGRGIGVQRGIVQRLLRSHPLVDSCWDAPDAHLGATIAKLKEGPSLEA
jgi:DNA-nicking Smr family endonuclease